MGSCFDKHGPMLSKLRIGTKKSGLMHPVVPHDKPRMEYCEDQHGTTNYFRAVQGHSHGVTTSPTEFSLKKTPLIWKEHIFHTGSSSNSSSTLETGLWGRSIKFEKHETSLFLLTSESARFVIETTDGRIGRHPTRKKNIISRRKNPSVYDTQTNPFASTRKKPSL